MAHGHEWVINTKGTKRGMGILLVPLLAAMGMLTRREVRYYGY